MKRCVIICGPTASGKTGLSLTLAKLFNGCVISADSMQIYRGMNIGTAKPTKEEQGDIPHYGLDICSPEESYSVVQYQQMAKSAMDAVHREGKLPILVGGTGLYIDSILYNTVFADVPENPKVRSQLETEYDTIGGQEMLKRLCKIDPIQGAKLSPADKKRIVRALEVYTLSGKTLTRLNEDSRKTPSDYQFLTLVLTYKDRELLYDRINQRVDLMLKDGLLEETKALIASGVAHTPTASQAIGYKELFGYLNGECSMEEAVEILKRRSRNYAKRQITWFKRYSATEIPMDEEGAVERSISLVKNFLKENV